MTQAQKCRSKNTPYLATRQPRLEREKRDKQYFSVGLFSEANRTTAASIRLRAVRLQSAVRTLFCPFRPFPPPCRQSSAFCTRRKQTQARRHHRSMPSIFDGHVRFPGDLTWRRPSRDARSRKAHTSRPRQKKRKGASTWPRHAWQRSGKQAPATQLNFGKQILRLEGRLLLLPPFRSKRK